MADMTDEQLLEAFRAIDPWQDDALDQWDALARELARRDIEA